MNNIKNELRDIGAGRWGSEIRHPIYEALKKLSDDTYDGVEEASGGLPVNWNPESIEEELQIIDSSIYGKEVKKAIHDALYKLYKMNKQTRTVITGLAPFTVELTEPTTESDLSKITVLDSDDPLSSLASILSSSGMFDSVNYSETDTEKTLSVFVGDNEFFRYTATYTEDQPYGYFWWYQITIYTGLSYLPVTFPVRYSEEKPIRYLLDDSMLMPFETYVTNNKIIITTGRDRILLCKSNHGEHMISLGMGDRVHENITDPYNVIRTFSFGSGVEFSDMNGLSQSWTRTSQLVLSALLSEGDVSYAQGSYCALTRVDTDNVNAGYTDFGTSRLYVSGCFAIED